MPKTLDFTGFLQLADTSIRETRLWRIDHADGVGVAAAVPYRPTKLPKHPKEQKGGIQVKCPYNGFKECIVQECPSCNYEEQKRTRIVGRYRPMGLKEALESGTAWEETFTDYEFISCKLIESGVHPVPPKTEEINNTQKTNVVIHKSIF